LIVNRGPLIMPRMGLHWHYSAPLRGKMQSYKELTVWQLAMSLTFDVYRASTRFPREEMYGLTSQTRRAAVSVASNIAEGQGRATRGEFVQFLCTARGSLFELETQLMIADELGYLRDTSGGIRQKLTRVAQLLNALVSSLRQSRRSTIHEPRST
jgi:four helix bundle protein